MPGLASQNPVLVNERKFVGDARDLPFVLSLLDARLLPDRYHATGRINSVYFDTPGLRAWDEKANGDNLKRKVRARWYGRPGDLSAPETPVFLELKRRIGSARDKVRAEVRAPTDLLRAPLSDPRWPALFAAHAPELGEPVGPEWAPVCRIEYDRVRYNDLENGSRVSVDWAASPGPRPSRSTRWSANSRTAAERRRGGRRRCRAPGSASARSPSTANACFASHPEHPDMKLSAFSPESVGDGFLAVREQMSAADFLAALLVSLAAAAAAALLYRFFYERRGTGSQIHR